MEKLNKKKIEKVIFSNIVYTSFLPKPVAANYTLR